MITNNDLISIVVPVYNAQAYLERCICSIQKQTYSNWELIIVDDGSTDDSVKEAYRCIKDDSRCIVVTQQNMGPDAARGSGVKAAKGKYLMFVDADDYIDKQALEKMYEDITAADYDIVSYRITRFNDDGKCWITDAGGDTDMACLSVEESMRQFFVTRRISGSYPGKLFKTSIYKDYPFKKDTLIGEDISGILYALGCSGKVLVSNRAYYNYYWNTNSISHSKYTKRHLYSLKNYIDVCKKQLALGYLEQKAIVGYFAEFEMAVATAMARANVFDKEAACLLRGDIRSKWKLIRKNISTPAYMKMSMLIFIVCPRVFLLLYRILYLCTGR